MTSTKSGIQGMSINVIKPGLARNDWICARSRSGESARLSPMSVARRLPLTRVSPTATPSQLERKLSTQERAASSPPMTSNAKTTSSVKNSRVS